MRFVGGGMDQSGPDWLLLVMSSDGHVAAPVSVDSLVGSYMTYGSPVLETRWWPPPTTVGGCDTVKEILIWH